MNILLIVLVSTLLSMCFFIVYRKGVSDGRKEAEESSKKNTIELNKANINYIKEYLKFAKYTG